MIKIPVKILILIIKNKYENDDINERVGKELIGAFPISMDPDDRIILNVIVGRYELIDGKYPVKKFSLYYPNKILKKYETEKNYPLLEGFSLRTAILQGDLSKSREILRKLSQDPNLNLEFNEYEDAMYWKFAESNDDQTRTNAFKETIKILKEKNKAKNYKLLSLSRNPELKDKKVTFAEEELGLFLSEQRIYNFEDITLDTISYLPPINVSAAAEQAAEQAAEHAAQQTQMLLKHERKKLRIIIFAHGSVYDEDVVTKKLLVL